MNALTVPATRRIYTIATTNHLAIVPASLADEMSLGERATFLLMRDLVRLGWRLRSNSHCALEFVPPETYTKDVVRTAMAYARNDALAKNKEWIQEHLPLGRRNLASGRAVLSSNIEPRIEVCENQLQHDIFRLFRYYWSSPYSDYVGRRMRLLIRDDGIEGSPVIGIAALGSSIIHIPDRDRWIGWDIKTRTERIVYMMDAYVLGALPPYNAVLGGKLVAYLLASNEVRNLFRQRYSNQETLINKREANDLVLIVTSSLYGKNSSQYNRLKYGDELLYQPIGTTAGFGTLHISNQTFEAMKELVEYNGCTISHRFGDGPNWRMRVIRAACSALNLDSEVILRHSFHRGLYAVPLADNWREFLLGESGKPVYRDMPAKSLVAYWKKRWLEPRLKKSEIVSQLEHFVPTGFKIESTPLPS